MLENRSVIAISGADKITFLQGIITNDARNISPDSYVYALMLTPQGKVLYDFFIQQVNEEYLLDCPKPYIAEIIKKFSIYKLRADITISDQSDRYKVYASETKINELFLPDPRHQRLGYRAIIPSEIAIISPSLNIADYELLRIELLVPDMVRDITPSRYFPLELHLDDFNAIDYNKGCYIGQEVVARTHYRGVVRKAIYRVQIVNDSTLPQVGSPILLGDRKVGEMLGCIGTEGLALLRIDEAQEAQSFILNADGSYIKVIS